MAVSGKRKKTENMRMIGAKEVKSCRGVGMEGKENRVKPVQVCHNEGDVWKVEHIRGGKKNGGQQERKGGLVAGRVLGR